ncbi:SAP30-binding protein [Fukomys damarensis]|uniref:SAP30-binding protein n=1 Tax=Fukomys damarensis TaxID=885580 RepID=A0A091DM16_FUKDA|nr:SAP30-binding protein [Fukomys damarensis]
MGDEDWEAEIVKPHVSSYVPVFEKATGQMFLNYLHFVRRNKGFSLIEKEETYAFPKIRGLSPISQRCSDHLQEKIQNLCERKVKEGVKMSCIIQRKKVFWNLSMYEKLIQFCAIDELGTNYPKDMFDPHGWSEDSYCEVLAKAQKIEMDKLEKAKKEQTNIVCDGHQESHHNQCLCYHCCYCQHSCRRCLKEKEQVGLCHPSDNDSAAHHSHHYGHSASCRLSQVPVVLRPPPSLL